MARLANSTRTHKLKYPNITLPKDVVAACFVDPDPVARSEDHEDLLEYLTSRLDAGAQDRIVRATRFAKVDKIVSTWQMLSQMDSARKEKQENTGQAQAISVNLPLAQSHLDDMVAFFAGVYSPSNGSFFQTPQDSAQAEAGSKLVDKLNTDARFGAYYSHLTKTMRALLKYNIGGFHHTWAVDDLEADSNAAEGRNLAESIDMYNVFWDPSVKDPSRVSKDAEWAAISTVENRRWFVMREKRGFFQGCGDFIAGEGDATPNGVTAKYFRYPPRDAGVSAEDTTSTRAASVNWESYGATLGGEAAELVEGFEVVKMYCWLNPSDFGLGYEGLEYTEDDYFLWRFWLADGKKIIRGEPVNIESDDPSEQDKLSIPLYMGYLNLDDMGDAQRSVAELLVPFQTFASFLMNSHVAGTRGKTYGVRGYDPTMFDLSKIDEGSTAVWLESKTPGRDVRSGLMKLDANTETSDTMRDLQGLMALVREFFPSQALPSQIAGMDRATTNQVSSVLQGVSRRLHMLVRIMDDSILSPMLFGMYQHLVNFGKQGSGLNDADARKILGSGLEQLNREIAEQAFRQLFFAILQNPQSAQAFDVQAMMNFWGSLLNTNVRFGTFVRQQVPAAADAQGAPVPAQADPNQPPIPGL